MHRSRLTVLVVLAAVAACSSHDDAQGTDLLAQDRTLVAGLDSNTRSARLPDACGAIAIAAQPAAGNQRQSRELSRKAFDAEMETQRGRVQNRQQLLEAAWDVHARIETRTVDMHVQRLRSKLGDAGDLIETVRGFGYRFKGKEGEE